MYHWKNLSIKNIRGEVWKPILSWEDLYLVSNKGRIKFLKRKVTNYRGSFYKKERILKQFLDDKGYPCVYFYRDAIKFTKKVHRLVGICFLENPNNYPCINHKKGVVSDNRVESLEWCTYKYNSIHSFVVLERKYPKGILNKKRTPIVQLTLNGEFVRDWISIADTYSIYKNNKSHIWGVCKGIRKSSMGYKWMYKEDYDALCNQDGRTICV